MMTKKEVLVIHCAYAKDGEPLTKLLEEAFRLYLAGILAAERHLTGNGVR